MRSLGRCRRYIARLVREPSIIDFRYLASYEGFGYSVRRVDAEDPCVARDVAVVGVVGVEHAPDVGALDLGQREVAQGRAGEQIAGRIGRRVRREIADALEDSSPPRSTPS